MKKNILSASVYNCTGCGACKVMCPHNAITISLNNDGFFSPVVNAEKCVLCGLCQSVCYKFTIIDYNIKCGASVYGVFSKNKDTLQARTSGGVAYEISKWGIEHGYKIFGVRYNLTENIAEHIIVDDIKMLDALSGSKYIQSYTSETLCSMISDAIKNPHYKYVCIGTPCQIYGLRKVIEAKKLQNEFILIDLFCHGVPSYLVWNKYIEEKENRVGAIKQIDFRSKVNGWHQYTMYIKGSNRSYKEYSCRDIFYRYFFDNVALNDACYNCAFRKGLSMADVRLGDFLGPAYKYREDGVSAVLIVSEVGRKLLDELQSLDCIVIDKKWNIEQCTKYQSLQEYKSLNLRNGVIYRLQLGFSLRKTLKWYNRQFPIKERIKQALKQAVHFMLPNNMIIYIKRIITK